MTLGRIPPRAQRRPAPKWPAIQPTTNMATTKPKTDTPNGAEKPLQFRNNPEIQTRLDAYKKANEGEVAYYRRVIKEAPDRAVDMLLYKDMQRHEADMRLVAKQLPQAQEFYDKQAPEVKKRIDQRLTEVSPYYKDKAFVGEVLREMGRQNRMVLTGPRAPAMAAG
jgi:hypothetical protein